MTDPSPYPMVIYGDIAFVVFPLRDLRWVADSVKERLSDLEKSGLFHNDRSRRLAEFAAHVLEVVPDLPPVKPAGRSVTPPTPPVRSSQPMSTSAAAAYLAQRGIPLSDRRITQLAKNGQIAACRASRVWLFDQAALDQYAAARSSANGNRPSPSSEMGAS